MTDNFEKAFSDLISIEGGYTVDKGGPTMYGVTETVARRRGYVGDMQDLPLSFAKIVYKKEYWHPLFDQIPYPIAFQLFDAAVNSGPRMSAKWLQQAVGVVADGKIGPITMAAIKSFDPLKLTILFNATRLEFMTYLSNWPEAGKGWARRIVKNLRKGVS